MNISNERIERLLVLLLLQAMKGLPQRDKVIQLNIAGFSNIEISEFLGTNSATIASLLYQSKKSKRKR